MRIWNDRIILEDGTVIMPEEVSIIDIHAQKVLQFHTVQTGIMDWDGAHHSLIDGFRIDRCTGMPDKNGKMIYENDRVKDEYGFEWVVTWRDGGFILCSDILSDEAVLLYEDIEVTGMEPYKEAQ